MVHTVCIETVLYLNFRDIATHLNLAMPAKRCCFACADTACAADTGSVDL